MEQTNILFTCAGRRNYLINYFKEALKGNGKIIAADNQSNAPSLIDADIAVLVPSIYSDKYIESLIKICKEHKVNAIISLNDLELPILSKHKKELEKNGTKVIISNELAIEISFDKWKTFEFLTSNGLLSPKTYIDLDKVFLDLSSKELKFPIILKPRWGSASIGIEVVETMEELKYVYELLKIKISRSILNKASNEDVNKSILIQEMINGVEYGIDILNDFYGEYYNTFVREKISMRSGETDKAISIINKEISAVGEKISKGLQHIGNLDCDVFIVEDKIYVLELNPRFGGGYPFSHEAGINTPAIYIDWLNGINDVDKHNNYKANIAFAKCDRLIKIPS